MKKSTLSINKKKRERQRGPILTSDKVDFIRAKKFSREKEIHYIMAKRSLHSRDTAILNMCAPKTQSYKRSETRTSRTKRRNKEIQL